MTAQLCGACQQPLPRSRVMCRCGHSITSHEVHQERADHLLLSHQRRDRRLPVPGLHRTEPANCHRAAEAGAMSEISRKVTCDGSGGKVTWLRVQDIAESARKHGISDDDMRHALRNPMLVDDMDDGLTMFVGPARDGALIEVGVADSGTGPVIVHAMRARRRYLRMKGGR
jgi:hypothetical protein